MAIRTERNEEAIVKRYAVWAPKYDQIWNRYSDVTLRRTCELVEQYAGTPDSILDVACGTGSFGELIRARFPQIDLTGTDLSPHMLDQARIRLPEDDRTRWIESTAESLPLDDNAYDVVTCNNAFHIVHDQPRALREFRRVLKPDGILIVVDWNRTRFTVKLIQLGYHWFGQHPRTITTPSELAASFRDAGFTLLLEGAFSATWFWKMSEVVGRNDVDDPPANSPHT